MVKNAPGFSVTVNTPKKKAAIMKLRQQKQNEQNKKTDCYYDHNSKL